MKRYTLVTTLITVLLLSMTGLMIWLEGEHSWMHMPRMIIGSIVVLFVPGYWITRWSFPLHEEEKIMDPTTEHTPAEENTEEPAGIDGLERFVLSIALSISAVPLVLFYINFLGVPLSIWSVFYTICGVTLASLGGTIFIEYRHAKHQ